MEINAEKRQVLGKRTRNIRKERKLPAVMFGKNMESIPLSVDLVEFKKVFAQTGETTLIDLKVDNKPQSVLVKDVQLDPISDEVIHVGFFKVDLTEKITAEIPVEVLGEEENELVKSKQAIVLTLLNEIPVEALPADFPSKFAVDVSKITEIGEGVTIADLEYDREKVEIQDFEEDEIVVKLDYAVSQEEVADEEPAATEEELIEGMEATEEAKEEEGEEGTTPENQES